MNKWHAELLGSPEWAAFLHEEILPVVTHRVDLGDDLLEIGPGPGGATEWLRHRVKRLVAIERSVARIAARWDTHQLGHAEGLPLGERQPFRYLSR